MTDLSFSSKNIRLESCSHGVKKIIFTRPDICNAFHAEMIDEMSTALTQLAAIREAKDMRLLILEGTGKVFSAGADLSYMKEQAEKNEAKNLNDARNLGRMFFKLASFPTPVVCAVKGAAIGGGLGLTACADYVLCDEKTIFATSEVLLGIVPAVISPYIIRKIGVAHASYFMLTGKKMTAPEAFRIGLANKVTSEQDFSMDLNKITQEFLAAGPNAARRTKELIKNCAPLPTQSLFEFCAGQIAAARCSEEGRQGLSSFFEKKEPDWIR
jgi:methylglutaconyl-CoA hydratase